MDRCIAEAGTEDAGVYQQHVREYLRMLSPLVRKLSNSARHERAVEFRRPTKLHSPPGEPKNPRPSTAEHPTCDRPG